MPVAFLIVPFCFVPFCVLFFFLLLFLTVSFCLFAKKTEQARRRKKEKRFLNVFSSNKRHIFFLLLYPSFFLLVSKQDAVQTIAHVVCVHSSEWVWIVTPTHLASRDTFFLFSYQTMFELQSSSFLFNILK